LAEAGEPFEKEARLRGLMGSIAGFLIRRAAARKGEMSSDGMERATTRRPEKEPKDRGRHHQQQCKMAWTLRHDGVVDFVNA